MTLVDLTQLCYFEVSLQKPEGTWFVVCRRKVSLSVTPVVNYVINIHVNGFG